jgi:isovaleryl-CoA dehydrogenase
MSFEAVGEDPLLEFRENVGQFAQSVIAPHAEEVDKANDFPKSANLWKEMGDFGLLGRPAWALLLPFPPLSPPRRQVSINCHMACAGITAPEEYGGLSMGYRAHCIAMEVRTVQFQTAGAVLHDTLCAASQQLAVGVLMGQLQLAGYTGTI